MSAVRRVLSGNLAAWVGIAVNLFTQFAIIPIYLSRWNDQTYGLWLAMQAAINLFELFDYGHQGYLQNEFLRIGVKRPRLLRKVFWSAILMGVIIGFVQVVVVFGLFRLFPQQINSVFFKGDSSRYSAIIQQLTVLNLLAWWLTGSCGGITVRLMAALGHYARFAWWSVLGAVLCNISPAISVLFGADLWTAGIIQLAGIFLYNLPVSVVMWSLLRRDGFSPVTPDLRIGVRSFARSQFITLTSAIDQVRNQGVRLLLLPLSGARELTAFTTMRTGANVLLQGVNSVTNPLVPELMRYLNLRDQAKTEVALVSLWFVALAGLSPGLIVLQAVAPVAFVWWTHGRIPFDPTLFALISLSVVVYAVAQPAVAVVQGNNRLPIRLWISVLTGLCLVGGILLLLRWWGIRGAGAALLLAEIVSAIGYEQEARRWLTANGMHWPTSAARWVFGCLGVTGIGSGGMILFPGMTIPIILVTLILQGALLIGFWRALSPPVRHHLQTLIQKRIRGKGQR